MFHGLHDRINDESKSTQQEDDGHCQHEPPVHSANLSFLADRSFCLTVHLSTFLTMVLVVSKSYHNAIMLSKFFCDGRRTGLGQPTGPVPEGLQTLAQSFDAVIRAALKSSLGRRPVGIKASSSIVPGGTWFVGRVTPPMNRWAILIRPGGLETSCPKADLRRSWHELTFSFDIPG